MARPCLELLCSGSCCDLNAAVRFFAVVGVVFGSSLHLVRFRAGFFFVCVQGMVVVGSVSFFKRWGGRAIQTCNSAVNNHSCL